MLEILILYIQATFKNSFPAIQDVHALAEQIKNGNTAFPSVYCTNDEYQPLEGNENFLYFRQLGAATEDESDEESVSGCDHYVTRTHPMVAVAYIPKNIFNTDNAFVDSKIAGNIANILRVANYGALTASMKADDIHAEVTRISTDRYEVWDQEFKGIDMAARFDHVLCAVEFDLVVSATETCLQNFDCNDETVTVEGDTILVELSDPSAWHKSGDLTGEVKKLGSLDNFNWTIVRNNTVIATIQSDGLKLDVLNAKASAGTIFLTTENGVIKSRTAAEVLSDIGAGTGVGTVTSVGLVVGSTGTDVNVSGSPVTTSGNITINIPSASATARGLVTIAAQTFAGNKTFNGQIILGQASLGMGQILFRDNTATLRHVMYQQGQNLSIFGIAQAKDEMFFNGASGNIAINSQLNTAKFMVRGDLNGSILYLDTSAGNQIFLARENAGSRQIGLYGATPVSRATTAGGAAVYVNNAGTALTSTDTFDGYTLAQVVLALRNIGVLT